MKKKAEEEERVKKSEEEEREKKAEEEAFCREMEEVKGRLDVLEVAVKGISVEAKKISEGSIVDKGSIRQVAVPKEDSPK